MTRDELYAAIQSYTENAFPAVVLADGSTLSTEAQLARLVTQAEQRIYNSVQFPALRKNVTGSTTMGNKYLQCPSDFLATYSMAVTLPDGSYEYLLNKDVNFIRAAYPNPIDSGTPRYYALFGPRSDTEAELTFILGPTPSAAFPVELHYFYYPESITTAADKKTWLGDNFDSVLLYGSLVEAYAYMKGEADLMTLYDTKYKEALALAKRLGDGMDRGDGFRDGQIKVPVG